MNIQGPGAASGASFVPYVTAAQHSLTFNLVSAWGGKQQDFQVIYWCCLRINVTQRPGIQECCAGMIRTIMHYVEQLCSKSISTVTMKGRYRICTQPLESQ